MLIAVLLIVVVAFGGPAVYRAVTAPWSIGGGGRETLTGTWVGPLRARQGAEYALYLDLEYHESRSGTGRRRRRARGPRDNLEGVATLCTPVGGRYEYSIDGRADWNGVVENLWLEYGDPSLSALNLNLSGPWKPGVLELRSNKNPFLPDGRFEANRSISSDDPDDSFGPITLRKGDKSAFEAACRRIRA